MTNFHVYILESPNPNDFYEKRYEGDALSHTLRLSQIQSSHIFITTSLMLKKACDDIIKKYMKGQSEAPIIHLSAHGNRQGIGLTDGTVLDWKTLRDFLLPLSQQLGGFLLCLSSCEGFSGCRMFMTQDNKQPCAAIISNLGSPTWAETNLAYATFYHLFKNGVDIDEAIKAMRIASNNSQFAIVYSATARQSYLDELKNPSPLPTISA